MGYRAARPSILSSLMTTNSKQSHRRKVGWASCGRQSVKTGAERKEVSLVFTGDHIWMTADSLLRSTVYRFPGLFILLSMGLWRTS